MALQGWALNPTHVLWHTLPAIAGTRANTWRSKQELFSFCLEFPCPFPKQERREGDWRPQARSLGAAAERTSRSGRNTG